MKPVRVVKALGAGGEWPGVGYAWPEKRVPPSVVKLGAEYAVAEEGFGW